MAKTRTIWYENHGMSRERHLELLHLSRQYPSGLQGGRMQAVEEAAQEACSGMESAILANVSRGLTYEQIRPPCGRNQFFEARQRYFMVLDRRLKNMEKTGFSCARACAREKEA